MDMLSTSPHGPSAPARDAASLLAELGLTHIVTLPDNTSAPLLDALQPRPSAPGPVRDGDAPLPRVIWATREGEAIAVASGLWLGGAAPAVLIQNTGLLEAGDALRGTASRMGAPLLLLITCRGFEKARAANLDRKIGAERRDILVRNDVDSVAYMTERTLDAWGIPCFLVVDAHDLTPIREGWARAREEERPVAVLLDTSFS